MNEQYAVDPGAPLDTRELKLLLDQFGLQSGRFLATYPRDWETLLKDRFGAISDLDRQRVEDLLRRRKASFLPATAPFQAGTMWANNAAVASERHRAFHGVIGQRDNGFGWPSPADVLYDDSKGLRPGIGAHVPMKADAYANCVRPLFQASAEVTLIDPFFRLRDRNDQRCRRHWPVMLALLKVAQASGTCQSIRLMLESRTIEAFEGAVGKLNQDIEAVLKEAKVTRINIVPKVVDDVGHGRYVISIHGGLQFDQGFEEGNKADNHVHWLSEPELEPLLKRFLPSTLLGSR